MDLEAFVLASIGYIKYTPGSGIINSTKKSKTREMRKIWMTIKGGLQKLNPFSPKGDSNTQTTLSAIIGSALVALGIEGALAGEIVDTAMVLIGALMDAWALFKSIRHPVTPEDEGLLAAVKKNPEFLSD